MRVFGPKLLHARFWSQTFACAFNPPANARSHRDGNHRALPPARSLARLLARFRSLTRAPAAPRALARALAVFDQGARRPPPTALARARLRSWTMATAELRTARGKREFNDRRR